ncbi:helicase-related protein [Emcibacter sp. SYSU 3D8]|uniref:helicase-related protein n=1 Tax=Emcibacter sp. SYSU 3D8 TaxID=3133969 RepID=UPI0031FEA3AC
MKNDQDTRRLVAVLGPTNTGKTHFAIERMLGHSSGMIGLPLRLLAREVYDKIAAMRGTHCVALLTGEEKIVPRHPSYWVCTVESMPLDKDVAFLAIDEVQLCADEERGHTFTDRLLYARGREETMFMGADSMAKIIRRLLPECEIINRSRFSHLSYAGAKKLTRLPRRSAIVAFTARDVYEIAELIRRRKGGAAIVMGALSPRTRNAQVEMYQNGEVDYIVATDAIGMGLNMSINHVAFASLTKFDGMRHRALNSQEVAQIAGRAGRHMNDGTFGVLSDGMDEPDMAPEVIEAVEQHRFVPVEKLQWRNAALDYASLPRLISSLERTPDLGGLLKAREAEDLTVLKALANDSEIRDLATHRAAISRLWEVCQVPDFRKTMADEHSQLVRKLYVHLMEEGGKLPEDWIAAQVKRLDRTDGDIDTLATRIAHTRTWTYIANRPDWMTDPAHWRGETRKIEDKLSDALHEQLTLRFVDRRSAVLMKRLQSDQQIFAAIDAQSDVLVEGHYVGRLNGLIFDVDQTANGAEGNVLLNAAGRALRREVASRVRSIREAADRDFVLETDTAQVLFGGAPVARLTKGADPLSPKVEILASDFVEQAERLMLAGRLTAFAEAQLRRALGPLFRLKDALAASDRDSDAKLAGLARGIAFRLIEALGAMPRETAAEDLRKLAQQDRWQLRSLGVKFGEASIFIPAMLKPGVTRHRLMCWRLFHDMHGLPAVPAPGMTSVIAAPAPDGFYEATGYRVIGVRAIRLDMLEKVAETARARHESGALNADREITSFVGCRDQEFAAILAYLGYQPKTHADGDTTFVRQRKDHRKSSAKAQRQQRQRAEHSPFAGLQTLKTALGRG